MGTKGTTVSTARWLCVAAAAGLCSVAMAQAHPEGSAASWGWAVSPSKSEPVPAGVPFGAVADEPIQLKVPPLHTIPPMPMPRTDGNIRVAGPGQAVLFDAQTGREHILPTTVVPREMHAWGGVVFNGLVDGMLPEADGLTKWSGTLTQAGGLTSFPAAADCKLAMRFIDQAGVERWFVCSGSMNDAGVIVTSAHCLYARDCDGNCNIFDWAQEVYVFPGWDGVGDASFDSGDDTFVYENWGVMRATEYVAYTSWTQNGSYEFEVATARVNRTSPDSEGGGRNIGMLTGWYGWNYGASCSFAQGETWFNRSFPTEGCGVPGLHNGQDMLFWSGSIDSCDGNWFRLNTTGGCFNAVWGGMSGSNYYWINDQGDRLVGAVTSTSNRSTRASLSRLWEGFVVDTLQPFEDNTRTSTFDPELLQYRYAGGGRTATTRAGTALPDMAVIVTNATNADPAAQNYTLDIYLSTNNNISTGDRLIATWNYNGIDFAAMQNRTFNVPGSTLPIDVAPGDYWVGAILRTVNGELTSANNDTDTWDAIELTVTLGLPDAASGPTPANLATNQSIVVDLDWANAARAASYNVYFGTDSTPDAGEFIGTVTSSAWNLGTLAAGTTYYWRVDTVNSAGTTTGPVWRFATAAPFFDLSPTAFDAPSGSYAPGDSFTVSHTINNLGNITSPAYTVRAMLSTNTIISNADTQIGSNSGNPILALAGRAQLTTCTIPPGTAPGTYYVGLIVDSAGDGNTANNDAVDTVAISVICPADFTGDGTLNIFDILTFFDLFGAGRRTADLTRDGTLNIFDILEFFRLFGQGC